MDKETNIYKECADKVIELAEMHFSTGKDKAIIYLNPVQQSFRVIEELINAGYDVLQFGSTLEIRKRF